MNVLFFLKPKIDLAYLKEKHTLRQALEKMKFYGFSAIPVLDDDGKYVGTISEGDLLWEVLQKDNKKEEKDTKIKVKDIMNSRQSRNNKPVNVNSAVDDLFLRAIEQNFIPVIDDRNVFIGIVTRRDVLKYYYYEEFLKNDSGN